jgi:hypothetical protein
MIDNVGHMNEWVMVEELGIVTLVLGLILVVEFF